MREFSMTTVGGFSVVIMNYRGDEQMDDLVLEVAQATSELQPRWVLRAGMISIPGEDQGEKKKR